MPSAKIHEKQALRNYSFFNSIQDGSYRDWKLNVFRELL